MPEYQGSRFIDAAPDDVFAFVSDVRNLPAYVITVESAAPLPRGRVRVQGRTGTTTYVDDGFVKVDEDRRRMEWRADELNYRGWLEVSDEDGRSRVFVHLSFGVRKIDQAEPIVADEPVRDRKPVIGRDANDPISASFDAALDSLHDLLEGRGGKRDDEVFSRVISKSS